MRYWGWCEREMSEIARLLRANASVWQPWSVVVWSTMWETMGCREWPRVMFWRESSQTTHLSVIWTQNQYAGKELRLERWLRPSRGPGYKARPVRPSREKVHIAPAPASPVPMDSRSQLHTYRTNLPSSCIAWDPPFIGGKASISEQQNP
jgi:hypothetical protein